jgi:Carboxylesterase family
MPLLPGGMFFGLIAVFALYSVALASQIPLDLPVAATATSDPPLLKLPYATYLGTLNGDILTFPNVRYAAAPTGTNRWQTPQSPATTSGIQSTAAGGACFQAKPTWIPVILKV